MKTSRLVSLSHPFPQELIPKEVLLRRPEKSVSCQLVFLSELNFENPMKRTSVSVPAQGYVVVRFKANNPGLWLFHCHILSHMIEGQSLIFRVADKGTFLPAFKNILFTFYWSLYVVKLTEMSTCN